MSDPSQPPPPPGEPGEFDIVFDEDEEPREAPAAEPPVPAAEAPSAPAAPDAPHGEPETTAQAPVSDTDTDSDTDSDTDEEAPADLATRYSRVEILSLAGIAVVVLAILVVLGASLLSNIPLAGGDRAVPVPKTPVAGDLVGIAALDAYWRPPRPSDRVRARQALVPEVTLRLLDAASAPQNGFLRLIIRDHNGKIRGDVTTVEVAGGRFTTSGTNETAIHGTEGFSQEIQLTGYAMEGRNTWTVEILEGTSYSGREWNRLAYFSLPSERLQEKDDE